MNAREHKYVTPSTDALDGFTKYFEMHMLAYAFVCMPWCLCRGQGTTWNGCASLLHLCIGSVEQTHRKICAG